MKFYSHSLGEVFLQPYYKRHADEIHQKTHSCEFFLRYLKPDLKSLQKLGVSFNMNLSWGLIALKSLYVPMA